MTDVTGILLPVLLWPRIVIFTVFVYNRVAPANTDIVTLRILVCRTLERFVSGVQVFDALSSVKLLVPYHLADSCIPSL